MMMPIVDQWSAKLNIPKQKLLMPLSFAALLGGMCTLIGTSTNLVLQGLVDKDLDSGVKLEFFTMTPVGAPVALACCLYMALFGQWILPDGPNDGGVHTDAEQRLYAVDFIVMASFDGQTVEQLGLTRVPGARLAPGEHDRVLRTAETIQFCATPKALLALCRQEGLCIVPLDPRHNDLGAPQPASAQLLQVPEEDTDVCSKWCSLCIRHWWGATYLSPLPYHCMRPLC
eukprot:TRINITY_DN12058_c0_g1_i4.p1 TRINITY_DN12058_c0_g1~~TRINITY_DN12058_c0_g1_i4.p1  ORF type:complete len:229 (-),score=49.31 TRINITY_DN12058_c0_g1_i4:814-1500(-)